MIGTGHTCFALQTSEASGAHTVAITIFEDTCVARVGSGVATWIAHAKPLAIGRDTGGGICGRNAEASLYVACKILGTAWKPYSLREIQTWMVPTADPEHCRRKQNVCSHHEGSSRVWDLTAKLRWAIKIFLKHLQPTPSTIVKTTSPPTSVGYISNWM